MGCTILAPTSANVYAKCPAPLVFVKYQWSDQWQFMPELRMVSADQAMGSGGAGSCVIHRQYGMVKLPWELAPGARPPWGSADGWWVRVCFVGSGGLIPVWTGRIEGLGTKIRGSAAHGPSGAQEWKASGAARILEKIHVDKSRWWVNSAEKEIGWVPDINDRDKRGWLVGNRSGDMHDGCYLYGGTDKWTAFDYVQYLLARFVDESATGGPAWSLGGQTAPLQDVKDMIPLGPSATVAEILKSLIPPKRGLDWTVAETNAGFEVRVFSLSPQPYSLGFVSLPANPNQVEITVGQSVDVPETHVAVTNEHGYKRLHVVGKRMMICCSIWGTATNPPDMLYAGTLAGKWTSQLEAEYKTGSSITDAKAADHDNFRNRDRFRTVYQCYGARSDWTHNEGKAAPSPETDGLVKPSTPADYQQGVRRTLSWTPLKEGWDYTVDPETSTNPEAHEAGYLPPALWICTATIGGQDCYQPAEIWGIGLSVSQTDWGFTCSANPNHQLAKGHWSGAAATDNDPEVAGFDYSKLVFTFAFESDQRCGVLLEAADWKPSDGTLTIEVEDAELWYLAAHTVVGVDSSLNLQTCGIGGRMLREDSRKLQQAAVGAVARYCTSRARAEIPIQGLAPWGELIGQILTVLSGARAPQWIGAPITAVSWQVPDRGLPTTMIHAGYARG